jgi:hypothetical protein
MINSRERRIFPNMKFVLNIMYKLDYDWIWCFNYSVDVVLELKIYSLMTIYRNRYPEEPEACASIQDGRCCGIIQEEHMWSCP